MADMANGVNKTWIAAINSASNGNKKSVSVHIIPLYHIVVHTSEVQISQW